MGGLVTEVERQYPKVWLITGSSVGVGRTIVEAALAAGDQVLATAREPVRLQDLVHRYGSRIRTVQHDVRNASAAATAVQVALDAFDRIDVVVNAARVSKAEARRDDLEHVCVGGATGDRACRHPLQERSQGGQSQKWIKWNCTSRLITLGDEEKISKKTSLCGSPSRDVSNIPSQPAS
jgi:NAD(P)-dependent dehydrogenase (short-subunit alcohol dehydrogenase family)